MKINSRSRIALDAMLDVAVNGVHLPVTLTSISERQEISLSYLEQLFRRLRMRGLVKSARGPGGGYQLNKRLSAISVADIVDAVDMEPETGRRSGKRRNGCTAEHLWSTLDRHLLEYLRTVSLESVLAQAGGDRAPSVRATRAAAPGMPARREDRRALATA
jgi:Rrf2 family iron-sulfur cluster assembly transcriptional regulator